MHYIIIFSKENFDSSRKYFATLAQKSVTFAIYDELLSTTTEKIEEAATVTNIIEVCIFFNSHTTHHE